MKVLVTGGCGLIGYHAAVYYKRQGHEVDVMDNLERSDLLGHKVGVVRREFNQRRLLEKGINVIENYKADVSQKTNFSQLAGHNLIVHLAAQCGVPTSIANPRRDYEVNLQGTFNVLEYAREHGATVVFASTNKVYPLYDIFDKVKDRWGMVGYKDGFPEEETFKGSRTPYGWSKYAADLLCQEYFYTYGVRTGVFRMSCIYGTHQLGFEEQGWATWFAIATEKGLPITIYGDGHQVRDMLYVEDCIKAYDTFVKSDMKHGIFNLGGGPGNTLTLLECLDILQSLTGKRSKVTFSDWRPSDQKAYVSNLGNIEKHLGWKPTVGPYKGLELVTQWVRENQEIF